MLKKLLASLLSVLCLLTCLGVNVAAEEEEVISTEFLEMSLFTGETVPIESYQENCFVNKTVRYYDTFYGDDWTKVLPEVFGYGVDLCHEKGFVIAKKTFEDDGVYYYPVLKGTKLESGVAYAIIVSDGNRIAPNFDCSDELGEVSISGYEKLKFDDITLQCEKGNQYYFGDVNKPWEQGEFKICEFKTYYQNKINSMSVDGIAVNANEEITTDATIKLDVFYPETTEEDLKDEEILVESYIPREDEVECNPIYFDADKFDEIMKHPEEYMTGEGKIDVRGALLNSGIRPAPLQEKGIVSIARNIILEPNERYYVFIEAPIAMELSNEKTGGFLPMTDYYKSNNYRFTINGKTATLFTKNIQYNDESVRLSKSLGDCDLYFLEFSANETTKQTNLVYSMPESYLWTITATINVEEVDIVDKVLTVNKDLNANKQAQLNVHVWDTCLESTNELSIYVDSKNDWHMTNGGAKEPYYIEKYERFMPKSEAQLSNSLGDYYDHEIWNEDEPIITISGVEGISRGDASGIFHWSNNDFHSAGRYEDTLTFTAEITSRIPEKGQIIFIDINGDGYYDELGERFKVVKNVDGTIYEVMGSNISVSSIYYYDEGECETESYNGVEYVKYLGSNIDDNLSEYYNNMPLNLQNAIVPRLVTQEIYSEQVVSNDMADIYSAECKGQLKGAEYKNVYCLDIDDIKEYVGNVSMLSNEEIISRIKDLYSDCVLPPHCTYILIPTSLEGNSGVKFYSIKDYDYFTSRYYYSSDGFDVFPAFQIDLSKVKSKIAK